MFRWLIFSCILLTFILTVFSAPAKLNIHHDNFLHPKKEQKQTESVLSDDYKTYYYTQTLDHFNYNPISYVTFKQRYVINSKYWGGADANAPILAFLGEESPMESDLPIIGFLPDNAPTFKALMIYIEHRFYGKSVPFGTPMQEAMKNETVRGYFSSAQALADYAEILLYTKKRLSALDSPIIVVGGSYGGMLASWFRLKYPHVAIGALASSAPILYFDNITSQNGYYSKVSNDFKECSTSCYNTIKKSWSEIDKVAAMPNGLTILSKKFNTCKHLNNSNELKNYLDTLYCASAQYDRPPHYPVTQVCGGINGAPFGSDVLSRIYAGLVAFGGNRSCYNVTENRAPSESNIGWDWQTCSEMVIPIGVHTDDTMFPQSPYDLNNFTKFCKETYGVSSRPHWITTYYGGHDIKLVLQRFASNIIFSNGLRDPYSTGGILENISDTVLSIHTKNGSHVLDILQATQDDPAWLVMQRKREVEVIQGWLKQYYVDLYAVKGY